MEWIESKIITNKQSVETISAVLIENNVQGFQVEDDVEMQEYINGPDKSWDYIDEDLKETMRDYVTITFYVSKTVYGAEMLKSVVDMLRSLKKQDLGFDFTYEVKTKDVNDKDWVDNWKKYFKPFKIGDIVVKPTWENYSKQDEEVVLEIDPGSVFGTGLHHSTSMCIEALQTYAKKGDNIIDLGCGSGILSIAGMLLGCESALAIDIDKNAKSVVHHNAKINNVDEDKYKFMAGDILKDEHLVKEITSKKYNIVLANIVADVIIGISHFAKEILEDDGYYIVSGIIDDREEDVVQKFNDEGLKIINILRREGWVAIIAQSE